MRSPKSLPRALALARPLLPLHHVIVRTPLLGFDVFAAWGDTAAGAAGASRAASRARLDALLRDPLIEQALRLASPALSGDIAVWREAPDSGHGLKVERALVKYLSRMAGKPTPLGLMGGYSLGTLGGDTRLELEAPAAYRRQSRLSYEYLHQLAAVLHGASGPDAERRLAPNTSLHTTAGHVRYARTSSKRARRYEWVALEDDEHLQRVLLRAREGATPRELAAVLSQEGVDPAEALDFVRQLLELEVLLPTLAPPLTALNGLEHLEAAVAGTQAGAPLAQQLGAVREALAELDREGAPRDSDGLAGLHRLLEPFGVPLEGRRLVQVDLVKPSRRMHLGPPVLEELAKAIALTHRIGAFPLPAALRQFRNAFVQRFGTREVPLLEALDPEFGVAFDPTLGPEDFAGVHADGATADWLRVTRAQEEHWLGKVTDALHRNLTEITLTDEDVLAIPALTPPPLPSLMTVVAAVAARSEAELEAGHFQVRLDHVSAGARLLSRAARVFPQVREELVGRLSRLEQESAGPLHAELVHLPEGAVGDLVARVALHEREIVFLGQPGVPPEHQLPVSDLRLSVVGARIHLRSERLDREIHPRLSNVHDYFGPNQPVYQFLATLEHQDTTPALAFSLGRAGRARFVPRIVWGRLVLCVARWTVWRGDLGGPEGLDGLRQQLRLPRFVYLEEGDAPLLVDLDNPLCADILRQAIERAPTTHLTEVFPEPRTLAVRDASGHVFHHELFVSFTTGTDAPPTPVRGVGPAASRVGSGIHLPGSDWRYLKFYAAPLLLDRILDRLAPLLRQGQSTGAIHQWFFIRYQDPAWHLRVRILGPPSRIREELLPRIEEESRRLTEAGQLWKLQHDTYEQELERYGGREGMAWAERLFHLDSEFALDACALSDDSGEGSPRWWVALRSTHELLGALGFTLEERWACVRNLRDETLSHPRGGQGLELFALRYRQLRPMLAQVLESGDAGARFEQALVGHLDARTRSLRPHVESARRSPLPAGWSLQGLAGSCVHMQVNRLLTREVKPREALLYDVLTRHYASALARQRIPRSSS
ncbi:lantibiotic dehydratase [Corallococcus llansteffanensis]|uniref:Lanthionine biosynthesis protein LanB n=1 Tax=Corallococcus llansteffanensis TaxID=2316731 RepID=A0A3A8PMC0_9BACT|nr:lantibiotic dehydratase [Corallococcus llansteffanensis]RKH57269.1 hypothetical protein D7V93_18765 [Corallococcus llansteffanensis]